VTLSHDAASIHPFLLHIKYELIRGVRILPISIRGFRSSCFTEANYLPSVYRRPTICAVQDFTETKFTLNKIDKQEQLNKYNILYTAKLEKRQSVHK